MNVFNKIAEDLFNKKANKIDGDGLFASLDELISMRQYVGYLKSYNKQKLTSKESGDVKSAFKGRGMELAEIRNYSFGDDVRNIDWRVTARKETPYTKLFLEEKDREIYVLLDLSSHMVFGTKNELKSVSAAKITALLGWLSIENKDRFGCLIFDGQNIWQFKPENNRLQMMAILKKVSEVSKDILNQSVVSEDLSKPLRMLEKFIKNNATVFILSDAMILDNNQQQLVALSKKTRLNIINIFDVLEETPPRAGEYMIKYNEKRLLFNSLPKSFQVSYEQYFANKKALLKNFCRKFSCNYIDVRTDVELYKQIKF